MNEMKRIGDLDIDQDMDYQWREWRIHRIGWAVFALILLASLVGLFGQGPLANARIGEQGSALVVDYKRFDRYHAPATLDVAIGPNVAQEGNVRLSLNEDFLDRIEIKSIEPEPESAEAGDDGVTYVFRVQSPDQPSRISFDFEYDKAGRVDGEVRLEGGPAHRFSAFVYP